VSLDGWPSDVSGLSDLDRRRARLKTALATIAFATADSNGDREAVSGRGRVLQGSDLRRLLARVNVRREPMTDHGLQFARRADAVGRIYFVSNPGDRAIDGWIPIDVRAETVMAFDPMNGRHGRLSARATGDMREVLVQIPAGGSLLIAESPGSTNETFDVVRTAGQPVPVAGPWTLRFVKGGPRLPQQRTLANLSSWTTLGQDEVAFSGTASYTATFARPAATSRTWRLDLGRVAESARVRLNGRDLGTLIAPPYEAVIDTAQLRATNTLEVLVTNLSANRVRELDQRGANWKKFYNVNFPARYPENRGPDGLFSAATWAPLDSGLLGPVTITPVAPAR
jgi:hypothetical protein